MRWLGDTRVAHGVVMSESWRLRAGGRTHVVRLLLWPACSHRSSTHASLTSLVSRVVEQGSDVVDEERVKQLCNSLFVREIQRAVEGYPVIVVSPAQKMVLSRETHQTPFKCIGPIFTTCLVFSLLRIPSRRPRVMPATFNSFVPLIMWLSSLLATQTPLASTWKHKLPSSSQRVAVTLGFIPGGAT